MADFRPDIQILDFPNSAMSEPYAHKIPKRLYGFRSAPSRSNVCTKFMTP